VGEIGIPLDEEALRWIWTEFGNEVGGYDTVDSGIDVVLGVEAVAASLLPG